MILSRWLERVFVALGSFFAPRQRRADPLDALYNRLEAESSRLVANKIERFKQTSSHVS